MEHASKLLSNERFWEIINSTIKNGSTLEKQKELLKAELMKLNEAELIGYHYSFIKYLNLSYRSDLWAIAHIVLDGCNEYEFDYFRTWLITRGEKVYDAALENADSLCNKFGHVADGDIPGFEDAFHLPNEVMSENFGKDIYIEEDNYDWDLEQPQITLDWEESNEESLRNICPHTFDKWG